MNAHSKNGSLWFWLLLFSTTLASIILVDTFVWKKPFTTSHIIAYPLAIAFGIGSFYLLSRLISRFKRFQTVFTYFILSALVCLLIGGIFCSALRVGILTGLIAGIVSGAFLLVAVMVVKRLKHKRKPLE